MPDKTTTGIEARPWNLAGLAWDRMSLFAHTSAVLAYRARVAALDCDLWCIQTSLNGALCRSSHHELNLLQPAEFERAGRYRHELDRRVFLAKRLLIRGALSHYAAIAPEDWRFIEGTHGRPRIVFGCNDLEIDFNLSSSGEMAVCVVSRAGQVGVDVEDIAGPDPSELFATILSAEEKRIFRQLKRSQRKATFLRYWTLKEAYVKACGIGLSMPVEQVSFDITTSERIAVGFHCRLGDDASSWEFAQHIIFDRYIVAVAKSR